MRSGFSLDGRRGRAVVEHKLLGCVGGGGAYVAYTMGAGMLPPPPPPPPTSTMTFWVCDMVFLALYFFFRASDACGFGAFAFDFFLGGIVVLY